MTERQQQQLEDMREQQAATNTSLAVLLTRMDEMRADVVSIRDRPPPGVPIWLIVLMSTPPTITSLALLVLVAINGLAR